jgi:CheY-like chemotaxis protein
MNMPGMGGLETAAAIRARTDAYASVPIIALTSQSDIGSVQACIAAGMNEVMVKPVQVGSLYACLTRQFARQRGVGALAEAERPAASPASLAPDGSGASGASGDSSASGNRLIAIEESDLLDENHLGELAALGLLDESFETGIEQIHVLIARLGASVANRDLEAVHGALHLLLGTSGNIGAKALHRFTRQIYPRTLEGEWPAEPDWPARIDKLGERSADALRRHLASANAGLEPPDPPGQFTPTHTRSLAVRAN